MSVDAMAMCRATILRVLLAQCLELVAGAGVEILRGDSESSCRGRTERIVVPRGGSRAGLSLPPRCG